MGRRRVYVNYSRAAHRSCSVFLAASSVRDKGWRGGVSGWVIVRGAEERVMAGAVRASFV